MKMQIKSLYFISPKSEWLRITTIIKLKTNDGRGAGERGTLIYYRWERKLAQLLWKSLTYNLKKNKAKCLRPKLFIGIQTVFIRLIFFKFLFH